MATFKVGDVICGTTPNTRDVMGRILEINHWFQDDTMPVAMIVIEDFPSIGHGIQFLQGSDLNEIEIINGSGLPPTRWRKDIAKKEWIRDPQSPGG